MDPKAVAMVERLAYEALVYSFGLQSRLNSRMSKQNLDKAIEYLRAFDPEKAGDSLKIMQMSIAIEEKEFARADELGEEVMTEAGKRKTFRIFLRPTACGCKMPIVIGLILSENDSQAERDIGWLS